MLVESIPKCQFPWWTPVVLFYIYAFTIYHGSWHTGRPQSISVTPIKWPLANNEVQVTQVLSSNSARLLVELSPLQVTEVSEHHFPQHCRLSGGSNATGYVCESRQDSIRVRFLLSFLGAGPLKVTTEPSLEPAVPQVTR